MVPVGNVVVAAMEPHWDYQLGQNGRQRWDYMGCCLLQYMEMVSEKVVNFNKLQEITQQADENPAIFFFN